MKTKTKIGWNLDNSYAHLPEVFYSKQNPIPVCSPELVIFNERLAESLGLDSQALNNEEGAAIFAGNQLPEGAIPLAQAYAGHQFGYFTMLGDGRALLLGEQITPSSEKFDIQLKGSGRTPYSRGGDGRAALGPMLREYIISEAMHALGIPTTRSLAVVKTGETVFRETPLPGAVLTRVAASHIRVGTFEYVSQYGTIDDLRILTDYTLQRHYRGIGVNSNPLQQYYQSIEEKGDFLQKHYRGVGDSGTHLQQHYQGIDANINPGLALLQETVKRQAALIAKWQLVGFIHGVMNTDNMVISGETIDYGPCAFMDTYDPATVFSSIDRHGRYAYGNQPTIGVWNLARFAETLLPLLHENQDKAVEQAQGIVQSFKPLFHQYWMGGMRAKLGIFNEEPEDEALMKELLKLMHQNNADYTNTFIALTFDKQNKSAMFESPDFSNWQARWKDRLNRQREGTYKVQELMQKSNPAVIPRNHRVEAALDAAVKNDDYSVMKNLLNILSDPYAHTPEQAVYASPPEPSCGPYRTFCGT